MQAGAETRERSGLASLEVLLREVRAHVTAVAPGLLATYLVFEQEARFGYQWLAPRLADVPRGGKILEVGAGLLLLSCQLQGEGFRVTAVEPVGVGFSDFVELQSLIESSEAFRRHPPQVVRMGIEQFAGDESFDLAFSVNVMEHVPDVEDALRHTVAALRPGAAYTFTCANYLFPYEPHFSILTLFSKRLTELVLARRIFGSKRVADPVGLWRSLNWISVPQVRAACARIQAVRCSFLRQLVVDSFERVLHDQEFARRRSPWIRHLARFMVRTGAHRMLKLMPPDVLPLMDCVVTRTRARA